MNEAGKETIVMLPTSQYSPKLVESGEQALDLPSSFVSSQCTTVPRRFSDAAISVWCNQLNAAGGKLVIERGSLS